MMGRFISLEGIEGVGKTTQRLFIQRYLAARHIEILLTREPGGTPVAEKIRQILLHPELDSEPLTSTAELLLLFAARVQHVEHVIKPALQAGKWVLCDRFTEASYAYQGGGRGIAPNYIAYLQEWIQDGVPLDCVLLLDAPVKMALERKGVLAQKDHIEAESHAFFERVRSAYLRRAKHLPYLYHIIDASVPLPVVQEQIVAVLDTLIKH